MFTIIYEPLQEDCPSRSIQSLGFWLGAEAEQATVCLNLSEKKVRVPRASPRTNSKALNIVVGGVYRCRDGWLVHIHRRRTFTKGQFAYCGRRLNPITGEASKEHSWGPSGLYFGFGFEGWHDYTIAAPYSQPQEG